MESRMNARERLGHIRVGGDVNRWHVASVIGEQLVSSHSWGVTVIVDHFWPGVSKELLRAAIYHDVAEGQMGDIPAHTKWVEGEVLTSVLTKIEARIEQELDIHISLTENEKCILRIADKLELLLFAENQLKFGNRHMNRAVDLVTTWLINRINDDPYKKVVTQELRQFIYTLIGDLEKELNR